VQRWRFVLQRRPLRFCYWIGNSLTSDRKALAGWLAFTSWLRECWARRRRRQSATNQRLTHSSPASLTGGRLHSATPARELISIYIGNAIHARRPTPPPSNSISLCRSRNNTIAISITLVRRALSPTHCQLLNPAGPGVAGPPARSARRCRVTWLSDQQHSARQPPSASTNAPLLLDPAPLPGPRVMHCDSPSAAFRACNYRTNYIAEIFLSIGSLWLIHRFLV